MSFFSQSLSKMSIFSPDCEVVNRWRAGIQRVDLVQELEVGFVHVNDVHRRPTAGDILRDLLGHTGLLGHVGHFVVAGPSPVRVLMAPQFFDEALELRARRIPFGGKEHRVAHPRGVAIGVLRRGRSAVGR